MRNWAPLVVLLLVIAIVVICYIKEKSKTRRQRSGLIKHRRKVRFQPYTTVKYFHSHTAPSDISREDSDLVETK